MVRITEAIFADGKLTPTGPLNLEEHQRVRITVEELTPSPGAEDRDALLKRLRESVQRLSFRSEGPYPPRDELYDRRLPG